MKTSWFLIGGASLTVVLLMGLGWWRLRPAEQQIVSPPAATITQNEPFGLGSPAFPDGSPIPHVYTCDGANTRPPLTLRGVPVDTKSLAVVMYDPDAPGGTFVHWVAWNIPPQTNELAEGLLPPGVTEGTNSFRSMGYRGPCPPSGMHRYIWRLYALGKILTLERGATREELEAAINTYVIVQTELMGRYRKQ